MYTLRYSNAAMEIGHLELYIFPLKSAFSPVIFQLATFDYKCIPEHNAIVCAYVQTECVCVFLQVCIVNVYIYIYVNIRAYK